MSAETRRVNGRVDEPGNPNGYQITFRTTRELSAAWSSLRGLCKRFGNDERTAELFREVVLPAMRDYVGRRGYLDRAREDAERRKAEKAAAKAAEGSAA